MASGQENATSLFQSALAHPPSVEEMRDIFKEHGLRASQKELEQYTELTKDSLKSLGNWAHIPDLTLPVKYPRTPGYRPELAENPCNAWAWKTDIKGASEGILLGKTVAVKDNIPVAGVPMRNGSFLLEGYTPDFDATIVTRLLEAGGTIAGKAVTENFCFSACSSTASTGTVTNPHNPIHSAGGSSSGSAALVGARAVDMAIGSDLAGSIRIPSSWCGIVSLKPTFGLVPFTGVWSMESSLEHLGPMTRTVEECATLLHAIAGYDGGLDPRQPVNLEVPNYVNALTKKLDGMKVGLLKEGFIGKQQEVDNMVRSAIYLLKDAGATVEEVSVPLHHVGAELLPVIVSHGGYRTMIQEEGAGHGWLGHYPTSLMDAMRKGLKCDGSELPPLFKFFMAQGAFFKKHFGLHYYAKAMNIRRRLRQVYNEVLKDCDVLLMPTIPTTATTLPTGGPTVDVIEMSGRTDIPTLSANTCQFNLTGHPALTINTGFIEGLPVGLQIVGRHLDDSTVLKVAYAFECLRDQK